MMFLLRIAIISSRNAVVKANLQYQITHITKNPIRTYANQRNNSKDMCDPKRVLSYEDMLKVIHQPEKVIIDVRDPEEVRSTGKIPSSINIPLNNVHEALVSMSHEEFRRQFQREKPSSSDELIFYCQSGRRSSMALDKALKMGYCNHSDGHLWECNVKGLELKFTARANDFSSKTYLGSWSEWSSRRK